MQVNDQVLCAFVFISENGKCCDLYSQLCVFYRVNATFNISVVIANDG